MKKMIKLLSVIFVVTFSFNLNVNAVEVNFSNSDWSGGYIDKIADGTNSNVHLGQFWLTDGRAAFCLEYGADVINDELSKMDIEQYFTNGLTAVQAKELVKQINKYLYFGYGSEGMLTEEYYIATQKLIWEAISKSGFYNSDYYGEKVKKYTFEKLEFQYEKTGQKIDLTEEVTTIENAIKKYETKPSLCSLDKDEIELNEEITFEDKNKVLADYKVTCSEGLNCKTDGNNLKITATTEGKDKKITFTKDAAGTATEMYKKGSYQGIVIAEGNVDAMSCEFTVDTFKKPETSDANIMLILITGLICGAMLYITYNSAHKQEI